MGAVGGGEGLGVNGGRGCAPMTSFTHPPASLVSPDLCAFCSKAWRGIRLHTLQCIALKKSCAWPRQPQVSRVKTFWIGFLD